MQKINDMIVVDYEIVKPNQNKKESKYYTPTTSINAHFLMDQWQRNCFQNATNKGLIEITKKQIK